MVDIILVGIFQKIFLKIIKTISKLNVSIIELGYLSDAKDNNGLLNHMRRS